MLVHQRVILVNSCDIWGALGADPTSNYTDSTWSILKTAVVRPTCPPQDRLVQKWGWHRAIPVYPKIAVCYWENQHFKLQDLGVLFSVNCSQAAIKVVEGDCSQNYSPLVVRNVVRFCHCLARKWPTIPCVMEKNIKKMSLQRTSSLGPRSHSHRSYDICPKSSPEDCWFPTWRDESCTGLILGIAGGW